MVPGKVQDDGIQPPLPPGAPHLAVGPGVGAPRSLEGTALQVVELRVLKAIDGIDGATLLRAAAALGGRDGVRTGWRVDQRSLQGIQRATRGTGKIQMNGRRQELWQRRVIERARDDEPPDMKGREDLGGDPSGLRRLPGPQEHERAGAGNGFLELPPQEDTQADLRAIAPDSAPGRDKRALDARGAAGVR